MANSFSAFDEIKKLCLNALERFDPANKAVALARLENELSEIEALNLAGTFLAAHLCLNKGLVIVPRGVDGSLVAYLLGLSELKPVLQAEEFDFGAFAGGYTLRLEVGRKGRNRLVSALSGLAVPLACFVSKDDAKPTLHPRFLLVAFNGQTIAKAVKLQDADSEEGLVKGAVAGEELPPGTAKLEIAESGGVALLQLILDRLGKEANLPVVENITEAEGAERAILRGRLDYFRRQNPAIFYAAGLTLAQSSRRAQIANAVRLEGLKLLPPDVKVSSPDFTLKDANTIISGLVAILAEAKAEKISEKPDYQDLNAFIKRTAKAELNGEDWDKLIWSGALDAFGEREALANAVPAILIKAGEYRAQLAAEEALAKSDKPAKPAQVQLSLFDMITPSQPSLSVPEVSPFSLPNYEGKVSIFAKLRHQQAVLEYDTSDHPLWNMSGDNDNPATAILTLAEALKADSGKPVIAGMVEDLRRVAVGAGEELTVVRLADWSGKAEMLVPPKVVSPLTLEEGVVLSARVSRALQGETAVLIAESIAGYPPHADELVPSVEEVVDFAVASDTEPLPEPPLPAEEPPPLSTDAELMQKLFFTDTESKKPADNQAKGDKNGKAIAPPKKIIQVHIHLPLLDSDTAEEAMIKNLYQILRQHPGEMPVNLYLPKPEGGFYHFQPQTTQVNGDADLIARLAPLVGGTDKIKVE